jgi:hypothetical protein
MIDDLNLFATIKGLKIFTRGKNRAIVYADETTNINQLNLLGQTYTMVTLISQSEINVNLLNTQSTDCEKISFKAVPKDKMIYEALGKGLKEYEYYTKSFIFTSVR